MSGAALSGGDGGEAECVAADHTEEGGGECELARGAGVGAGNRDRVVT